jgi:hypothetical protein
VEELAKQKVDAIYDLRDAVEQKVHAEVALEREDSPRARDALLEATLEVESKTQDAIDVCGECGRPHAQGQPHTSERTAGSFGNVIAVDFRPAEERSERER